MKIMFPRKNDVKSSNARGRVRRFHLPFLLLACAFGFLATSSTQAAWMLEPGDHTVIGFGDSTTAPRPEDGVTVYCDMLRDELPRYGITGSVLNKGIGGNTTTMGMARFQTDVRAHDPDLVVIQFGLNDAAVDVWKTPPATQSRVSLSTYTSNITSFVQTLKSDGAQVVLMTTNPARWTDELLGLYGSAPYDPNDPMGFNTILVNYNQAVRSIAAAESVPLVDVYNMYLAYDQVAGQSMDDLLVDGMHPNTQGQRLVGDALRNLITENTPLPPPLPPQPLPGKVSEQFEHTYEANGLPWVEDIGAGKTNWALFDHPNCDAGFAASGGVLSYSTMSYDDDGEWFYTSGGVPDSAWVSQVGTDSSYTVEFRAKITGGKGNVPGLHFFIDNGAERLWLNIDTDHIATSDGGDNEVNILAEEIDNESDFHVYRIAFDVTDRKFQIWRDDVLIGEDEDALSSMGYGYFGFGDGSSMGDGSAEIDYIRWDANGAYAPFDPICGDANGDGKIDDGDAAILAENWLTSSGATWAMGDFNNDGKVNDVDATLMAANWHAGVTASAAVPEPTSIMLLLELAGLLGLFTVRLLRRNF